jgi:hypothetical protein
MIDEYVTNINIIPDKIQFDDPKPSGITYYKLSVYNPLIKHPLQKFWFHLPKVKIINIQNKNNISIALSNNTTDDKIINYITEIELLINKYLMLKLNKTKYNIQSSFIIKDDYATQMCISVNNNTTIFDENDNDSHVSYLKTNTYISCLIELSEILMDNTQGWIIWSILQIKILPAINFKTSLFSKINDTSNQEHKIINHSICAAPPLDSSPSQDTRPLSSIVKYISNIDRNNTNEPTNKSTGKLMISTAALLDQINKLKKNKIRSYNHISTPPTNPLLGFNKIIPKEPAPLSEWYNKAKQDEIKMNKGIGFDFQNKLNICIAQRDAIKDKINKRNEKYNDIMNNKISGT